MSHYTTFSLPPPPPFSVYSAAGEAEVDGVGTLSVCYMRKTNGCVYFTLLYFTLPHENILKNFF